MLVSQNKDEIKVYFQGILNFSNKFLSSRILIISIFNGFAYCPSFRNQIALGSSVISFKWEDLCSPAAPRKIQKESAVSQRDAHSSA